MGHHPSSGIVVLPCHCNVIGCRGLIQPSFDDEVEIDAGYIGMAMRVQL